MSQKTNELGLLSCSSPVQGSALSLPGHTLSLPGPASRTGACACSPLTCHMCRSVCVTGFP